MANRILDRLRQDVDAIAKSYDEKFAGQSRHTRDPGEMDGLISRMKGAIQRIELALNSGGGADIAALRDRARAELQMYENEKLAIRDAKEAGPDFERFAPLSRAAGYVFGKYRRHFAGRSRATRDLALLQEMVADLEKLQTQMRPFSERNKASLFQRDLEVVTDNLGRYRTELEEITKAQAGGTAEEQSDRLAEMANGQFDLYRVHFAGFSRGTRRPELLDRMIKTLTGIRDRMRALKSQVGNPSVVDGNIAAITQNLEIYAQEAAEIRKSQSSITPAELAGNLGGHANEIFDAYRNGFAGKSRTTVDPQVLSDLCDRLGEVRKQMESLLPTAGDTNTRNLEIVSDYLAMFETEFDEIQRARAPN